MQLYEVLVPYIVLEFSACLLLYITIYLVLVEKLLVSSYSESKKMFCIFFRSV